MISGKGLELVRLGVRNLIAYPLRTFLTTLGIVCGVSAVIAMMALGAGAEQQLLEEIGRLGIQNIILNSVKPPEKSTAQSEGSWMLRYGLTFRDEQQIQATVPGLERVLPVQIRPQTVWEGSRKTEATVYAVHPEHMQMFGLDVLRGRNIEAPDGAALRRVCVVRAGLLRSLGSFEDPLHRMITIDDEPYEVVGILRDEEFRGYAQEALAIDVKSTEIYVPYETVLRREGTESVKRRQGSFEATNVELSQVVVSVEDIDHVLVAARMLQRVLQSNHEEQDYKVVVPLEVLEQRRRTQDVMRNALIAIAGVSLLVGGIGIANIMLATVTERTREIGVRRALGATRAHIVAQFLTETTAISGFGGIVGVAASFLVVWVMSLYTGWAAIITPASLLLALGISMIVGIAFGILPARRAALLDPIAALRHE